MKRAGWLLALLLLGCGASPLSSPVVTPDQLGLTQAIADRPVAQRAISIANSVRGNGDEPTFAAGWLLGDSNRPIAKIPVYVLNSENLAERELIFVSSECACVLIQGPALIAWIAMHSEKNSATMHVEPENIIAFM